MIQKCLGNLASARSGEQKLSCLLRWIPSRGPSRGLLSCGWWPNVVRWFCDFVFCWWEISWVNCGRWLGRVLTYLVWLFWLRCSVFWWVLVGRTIFWIIIWSKTSYWWIWSCHWRVGDDVVLDVFIFILGIQKTKFFKVSNVFYLILLFWSWLVMWIIVGNVFFHCFFYDWYLFLGRNQEVVYVDLFLWGLSMVWVSWNGCSLVCVGVVRRVGRVRITVYELFVGFY